ncbi:hypothetical protein HK100_009649 [Physocladia obscura]|uniref:J domain-containing protein n=1 Tax=Physocladia obscura TaxID=109957 RepID=A0AAD5T4V2_9FUNG|nr:hypothetical protein HK100_009649 [Physocladia obscura]
MSKEQHLEKDPSFNIDTYLRVESTSFAQDKEAERILALAAKAANPIEVLDLDHKTWLLGRIDDKDIKLSYRKKSLLLHPDKCKHPRAQDAFEMLKKAETELSEEGKRAWLLGLIAEARSLVFKRKGIPLPKPSSISTTAAVATNTTAAISSTPISPFMPDPVKNPSEFNLLLASVKVETRRLLIDQGKRDSVRLKNEVDRKNQEEIRIAEERKRKAETDKTWEQGREERVNDWRSFIKKTDSKKKRKSNGPELLG